MPLLAAIEPLMTMALPAGTSRGGFCPVDTGPLPLTPQIPSTCPSAMAPNRGESPRARVGEQDVQPPMALHDCTDEHGEMLEIGDIAANARRVVSDPLDGRVEFRLAPASDDNRRALECQTPCRRQADARGAAGNDSNLAFVLRGVNLHCVSAAPRFDSTPS